MMPAHCSLETAITAAGLALDDPYPSSLPICADVGWSPNKTLAIQTWMFCAGA
jgi:hypothetical protein